VIEDVERLGSQLNFEVFIERQDLGHGEVHTLGWWTINNSATSVSNSIW
jgi:hypothetical protein